MADKKTRILGLTNVTTSYSATIVRNVRKELNLKVGDIIGFFFR